MADRGSATVATEQELGDERVLARWRELAEMRSNPFLTPEWTSAWRATYPDEQAWVVLWRCDGELRGVLPLVRVRRPSGWVLRFAGARRGDWFTPACARADERAMGNAVARLLAERRGDWRLLELDRVAADSEWPSALRDASPEVFGRPAERRTDVLPFIDIGEGYDAYFAGRSRNFRSQLGRRRRKLERDHGLTFRMTATAAELDADLRTFFVLHDERWDGRGGSSSGQGSVRELHRRFAAAMLQRGALRLWIGEADGEPASAWYGWRIADRYCYALAGLSAKFESLALGNVTLAHTIEQAADEGARIYDLMWGDEPYKQRFETGRRQAATWTVGRRRSPALAGARVRNAAEQRARDLPEWVERPLRRVRSSGGQG
jgi:CelD/BcsL family acetyltransferase involved in cellulose biosynthesis